MPNFAEHARAGAVVGLVAAAYSARNAPTEQQIVESVGGLIGGYLGGILPDVLEPANSPHHRQLAHSVVTATAFSLGRYAEWQAACRSRAGEAAQRLAACAPGSPERSRAERDVFLFRLLAGFLVGVAAGYVSHLALDARTPRGIPWVGG